VKVGMTNAAEENIDLDVSGTESATSDREWGERR